MATIEKGKDPLANQKDTKKTYTATEVKDISDEYRPMWNDNVQKKATALGQLTAYDAFGNLHRASTQEALDRVIYAYNADGYQKMLAEQQNKNPFEGIETLMAQSQQAYENAKLANAKTINQNRDMSAREYYQLYRTQEKDLPENLSKAGVTGGASESANLKLMNQYANNMFKNENARNAELNGADARYNEQVAQNSVNMANTLSSQLYQSARDKIAYDREDAIRQQTWAREDKANADAQRANELEMQRLAEVSRQNDIERANEAKKQQEGYTTKGYYDSYSGLYKWNVTGTKKKVGSSGGSGNSGGGGNNTGSGKDPQIDEGKNSSGYTSETMDDNARKILTNARTKMLSYGGQKGYDTALNYVESQYKNGAINDAQAEFILKNLNLGIL